MLRFGILVITLLVGVALVSNEVYAKGLVNREPIIYRPITLTVLDAETRQPLEGISVIVVNVIGYSRFFIADSITRDVIHFYEFTTDEHGVVQIPQFNYRVNRHHFIHLQRIGVNIELRNPNMRIRRDQKARIARGPFINNDFFSRPRSEFTMGQITYATAPRGFYRPEWRGRHSNMIHKTYEVTGWREDQTRFPSEHAEATFYLERLVESVP